MCDFRADLVVVVEAPDAGAAADAPSWLTAAVVQDRHHQGCGAELAAVAVGAQAAARVRHSAATMDAAPGGDAAAASPVPPGRVPRRADVALAHARTLAGERGAGLRPAVRGEPAPAQPRRWTTDDDAMVLASPARPAAALGRALGRTAGAVHQRRHRLRRRAAERRVPPPRTARP
jgi:hypothetical protein